MTTDEERPRFEIAAAVVFRLGEELISDVVQALVELVKNSYDADATWANVTITSPDNKAAEGSKEAMGMIIVADDGQGMNADDFRRGWLMIANSSKKIMKDAGKTTTKRKRTPVGDKGLGRLGVQRLGYEVEIISRVPDQNTKELKLSFSWKDFSKAIRLSEVPVKLDYQERSRKRAGTTITVWDLKNPEQWTDSDAKEKLQRSLSELISPFREVRDFNVTVTLDGENIPIAELTEQLRDTAAARYKLSFDGNLLTVSGTVRLDFVARAQKKDDRVQLQHLLQKDGGSAFFDYLNTMASKGRPPMFKFHENSKWVFSFEYNKTLSDLGGVNLANNAIANPGAFSGEVDYLLLDSEEASAHTWDSISVYRKYVETLAGIRVYRDGFGIRVGEDWLNIGREQTSGGSFYGLRPKNVIGFIAISAHENRLLLETTSREGFQKTPHYLNFYALLQSFVQCSSQAQEYLRRGALDFLKTTRTVDAGIEVGSEIQSASQKLREQAAAIDHREQKLSNARKSMEQLAVVTKSRVKEITDGDEQFSLFYQDKLNKLNNLVNGLDATTEKIKQALDEQQPKSTTSARAQEILDVVLERDARLRQELEMFYEGVALGLTAEALSHEIANIADRLAQRSSTLASQLSQQTNRDSKVLTFIEHVKSSVAALRKQLSHLAPSLRFVRERRNVLAIDHEIQEVHDFYKKRFDDHNITMVVQTDSAFHVLINRGKLNQVFDNILLNSEYWLREARRKDVSSAGTITLQVDRPFLRIWDNGPGVANSVEDNLFDPFITTKGQGKGRGLGLFIVQQLLDVDGCSIRLLPERNDTGRRFKFEIDLGGAIHE